MFNQGTQILCNFQAGGSTATRTISPQYKQQTSSLAVEQATAATHNSSTKQSSGSKDDTRSESRVWDI
jgi:hypothetical protein